MEDIPYDDRDCSSDYWLDWRSDLLSARNGDRHRKRSGEPSAHGEQWSAEHIAHRHRHSDANLPMRK
jgi:hypothetical protein